MLINNNVYIKYQSLKDIATYLQALTGATIGVWDSEGRTIYGAPDHGSRFCSMIDQCYHDRNICYACDNNAAKKCEKTFAPFSYVCHAGLSETVVPVIHEKKIYLFLILGQYINADKEKESAEAFAAYCRAKKITDEEFGSEYKKLPKLSQEKVNAFIEIAQLLCPTLWNREIVKVRQSDLFSEITGFIDENISLPLTVQSISAHFFISKNNLYTLFEEYCGMTIKKYITEKRLSLAKELLSSTQLPISAISDRIGASSYGVFIQLFKNAEGISPAQYRKAHKNTVS